MLRRLSRPVRSLSLSQCRAYSTATPTPTTREPLRILFCGSDEFSISSLRALVSAQHAVPNLIASIDVLHRPPKPTGRGLKTLREVPIQHVATADLTLPTHSIDTFTGWTPPSGINLVIAVSFGLFVPRRILGLAKYGGLNVHPSLLPDLRGPAPIEHAILKRREYTGVSIQTLDPQQFDHGTILAQTAAPGIPIPHNITTAGLKPQLAALGAEMLVEVLKTGRFIPPLKDVGWYTSPPDAIEHAPKITKQDAFVDLARNNIEEVLAVNRALGDAWCVLANGDRLKIHKVEDTGRVDESRRGQGIWAEKGCEYPLFCDANGKIGAIVQSTYAGSKAGHGNAKLLRKLGVQG